MPIILRTRVPIARIAEFRLPRLEGELPAVSVVVRAIAPVVIKPKEEDHEQTT